MTVHARPGTKPFAACLELFSRYPLAVTPHGADGRSQSMVLMDRAVGPAGYFVLTQARDDLFVIRPEEPVSDVIGHAVTASMPVPRDGALLGWVTDSQVTVLLAVHGRPPEAWDAPAPVPEIQVLPMAGTIDLLHWPSFTVSPLGDGRLWEYVERGRIVDLAPLIARSAGRAFWVPSADRWSARHEIGCVVVTGNLPAEEYWLPAGVYMDHWTLREGIQAPPVGHLLALPGIVDLARRLGPGDRR